MTQAPTIRAGDRWFAALQYILPKQLLSRVIYSVARSEARWIRNTFLRIFLSGYRLNMAEAVQSDPFTYPSFNAFFTARIAA
jgi:phosphatidylserine decarboxylase